MHAITTGALRTKEWRDTEEHFFTTGFQRMSVDPVLAGMFAIINLRDVSGGSTYGYYWRLHVTVAVAVDPFGPYDAHECGTEGIASLASWHWPSVDTFAGIQGQALGALSWVVNKVPQVGIFPELRARNQIAQAEYFRAKAEGARQGVADRLWRDRLLDDAAPGARADMAAWVHEFGERPMPLARERSLHEMACMRQGLDPH